ncbi:hypothetical protein PAHAL_7G350000 [Panicum hallii]|uniref:Uncharacterized protein n=1 Tax=Panicum hallii TaxID=206008 RepID=A0A2T8IEI7_9POAL|nr:hypothetical protein PAHAL_7G350000 [Panicum hallii]
MFKQPAGQIEDSSRGQFPSLPFPSIRRLPRPTPPTPTPERERERGRGSRGELAAGHSTPLPPLLPLLRAQPKHPALRSLLLAGRVPPEP